MTNHRSALFLLFALQLFSLHVLAQTDTRIVNLQSSYRFLISDRSQGGVLYEATAGELKGMALPLGFYDTADYWGLHVCEFPSRLCAVTDIYNAADYSLQPLKSLAGDLQTERVNIHDGSNIYDAATWQIAVVLGQVGNGFVAGLGRDAYALASNQNRLLKLGYSGNAPHFVAGTNRAVTVDERFTYNGATLARAEQAYLYRMLPRRWLSADPLMATRYESLIAAQSLPANNPAYRRGMITWTDWKPFTGENAWALLIGPLQAAHIHYVQGAKKQYVPFADLAVENALQVLPAFVAMQSAIGGVYYAPAGTLRNQGQETVNPFEVAVENNVSLLAGLEILRHTLRAQLAYDKKMDRSDIAVIHAALAQIHVLLDGGKHADGRATAGLFAFFRKHAWVDGEFVQGGLANVPGSKNAWQPTRRPRAVDANTWAVAALGARRVDDWFGFGASYRLWQQIKQWGAYGQGATLWGVGFSDQDGNGRNRDGSYRQGVMSAEWTAGAINMLRNMMAYYSSVPPTSQHHVAAKDFVKNIADDEAGMLTAVQNMRYENYLTTDFAGKPESYAKLVPQLAQPYLYSSRRFMVPFGWYANPLPSTCATSWMIMLANRFDPLGVGGQSN